MAGALNSPGWLAEEDDRRPPELLGGHRRQRLMRVHETDDGLGEPVDVNPVAVADTVPGAGDVINIVDMIG